MTAVERVAVNFVLTGEVRSGSSVVLTAINNRGGVVCHSGLLAADEAVRRESHVRYFGGPDEEGWLTADKNPFTYVNGVVFDNALHGETAVGLHVTYADARRLELFELMEERTNEGDFCAVHVVRNPLACFISLKQAEQSGLWRCGSSDRVKPTVPAPVRLMADEATAFCRAAAATAAKVRAACDDVVEIQYRDLVENFQAVMRRVFDHIELPDRPNLARPGVRRLRNRPMRDRVTNWDELARKAPRDVMALAEAEDLF